MIYENTPKITTERLILRQFTPKDAPDMLEILSDLEINTFLPWFPLQNIDEARLFLEERFLNYYGNPPNYRYAICLNTNNKPIGYVTLSDKDSNDFGYGLKKEFWNQGIVTEASSAIIKRIKKAGYPYITATHDINNPRSGSVMKKLGMSYQYSYIECVHPKNVLVTFRMYQLNFTEDAQTYMHYWETYSDHFIEEGLK